MNSLGIYQAWLSTYQLRNTNAEHLGWIFGFQNFFMFFSASSLDLTLTQTGPASSQLSAWLHRRPITSSPSWLNPTPKIFPTVRVLRPRTPQWYDTNTELESMVHELYDDTSDPYCRELGENLLESFDALIEAELPCLSAVPDFRYVLVQYQRHLKAQRDSLWNDIYAAMEATEEHWQEIAGHVVWPQVTICSGLSLLALDRWERVPTAWRVTLLVLAEIISSSRRSERLLAYYDQNDANKFFKEAQNGPGDSWDKETNPDWFHFEIENDLTIRKTQGVVVAEETNRIPRGNTVYQMDMGEGKTAVITPLVVMNLLRNEAKI
ncbi:hypothetical protein BJX99DRAFT_254578 [Aspergillus californicus]